MIARLENAALVGALLSLAMFLSVWLSRHRSARERSALWAVGFAAMLSTSLLGLRVHPLSVALRLPWASPLAAPAQPARTLAPAMGAWSSASAAPSNTGGVPAPRAPLSAAECLAALWLLVASGLLARWGAGFVQAGRVLRESTGLDPGLRARISVIAPDLGTAELATVRLHHTIAVPLTVGFWRSRILLPESARLWRKERLAAVLAHELAHVRRHDGPVRSLAQLCAVLHWFNPLVWIAANRLEEAQEVAADDALLEAGWLASGYARELLAMADALNAAPKVPALALTMVRRSQLMARLLLILGPARRRAFSPRFVTAFGAGLAILSAGLVALRPVVSFAQAHHDPAAMASSRVEDGGFLFLAAVPQADAGTASPAGSADGSVALATGQSRPGSIVADDANLYWVNFEGGTVMKLPRAGGEAIALADGQAGPQSLAVDEARVYWSDFHDGTIRSVPIAGGEPRVLAANQDRPSGIAVDARHVYWVTREGSLWTVPLEGGDPDRLVAGEGSSVIEDRSLVADGDFLYWTDSSGIEVSQGRILRYDLVERRMAVLADHQASPCRLAVDRTNVYWTNLGTRANQLADGTVMQIAHAGGTPVVLASGQLQPLGIAVDAGTLYWTRAPLNDNDAGSVMRLALADAPGTEANIAAWKQRRPAGLALKSGSVYWTDAEDGTVRSFPHSLKE